VVLKVLLGAKGESSAKLLYHESVIVDAHHFGRPPTPRPRGRVARSCSKLLLHDTLPSIRGSQFPSPARRSTQKAFTVGHPEERWPCSVLCGRC
jgi:hypothetical protein